MDFDAVGFKNHYTMTPSVLTPLNQKKNLPPHKNPLTGKKDWVENCLFLFHWNEDDPDWLSLRSVKAYLHKVQLSSFSPGRVAGQHTAECTDRLRQTHGFVSVCVSTV